MQIVEIDIRNNPLTDSVISLINQSKKIYLLPKQFLTNILEFTNSNKEFNNPKFYTEILDILSFLLRSKDNYHQELVRIANKNYIRYIDILFELKIIVSRDPYSNGVRSFNYRIDENVFHYEYVYISLYKDDEVNIYYDLKTNIDDNYKYTLENADIFVEKAILAEYLYLNKKDGEIKPHRFLSRINNILNFRTSRTIKKGKKVNRLYSSFTMLSNVARKYVHINGKTFHSRDLKNAQPVLLANYLSEYYSNIEEEFISNCTKGIFYESIMKKAKELKIYSQQYDNEELRFDDRDDVKKLVYLSIFFDQKFNSKTFKIFNELYPMTSYNLQRELAEIDSLAQVLQNKEAEVFLNICPDCYYYTVHDSIYFIDIDKKDFIQNKIEDILGNNNFTLDFEKAIDTNYDVKIDKIDNTQIILLEKTTKDKVVELFNQGFKQIEIAKQLNITRGTVSKYLK